MLFITQEEELQIDKPLQALYFYASWMPYHSKFLTMISKVEEKYKDISFSAIDVDAFKNQCKRFTIDSIPTVLILKEGKEIKRIKGLVLTSAFRSAFADICTS
jgi:thioredoxin-like negative regulator of GroEL